MWDRSQQYESGVILTERAQPASYCRLPASPNIRS
jgi:hypothetical protein